MRRLLLICLYALLSMNTFAQISIADLLGSSSLKGESINLTKDALAPELSIIRQQYRLERNGETYGKNGKSFYGETYTLAIKVAGGLYVSGHAIEPWRNDADYERVNVDKK